MKCKECGCSINLERKVRLITNVGTWWENYSNASPYTKCHLLHWDNGDIVFSAERKEKAYLINEKIVTKKQ